MPSSISCRATTSATLAALACLLAACGNGGEASETEQTRPFDAIADEEVIRFTGTEPFWGGQVSDTALTYTTPERPEAEPIEVERFAGRGGVSYSGMLDDRSFDMMVTEGNCSDGMSDRTYPFNVTLRLGSEIRTGCAWTDRQGFTGPEAP